MLFLLVAGMFMSCIVVLTCERSSTTSAGFCIVSSNNCLSNPMVIVLTSIPRLINMSLARLAKYVLKCSLAVTRIAIGVIVLASSVFCSLLPMSISTLLTEFACFRCWISCSLARFNSSSRTSKNISEKRLTVSVACFKFKLIQNCIRSFTASIVWTNFASLISSEESMATMMWDESWPAINQTYFLKSASSQKPLIYTAIHK